MRQRLIFFILWTVSCTSFGQDLHFSQYYRTPLLLNPANTGGMEQDLRLMAIARNQWQTIPVPYNSYGISADVNFPFQMNRDRVGLGMQMTLDRAGDSKYTTFQGSLSGAYHFTTVGMNYFILSIGGAINYYQRSYNPNVLTFDHQFNGDYFDPKIPVNELFDRLSLSFIDFGLGINYQQTIMDQHVINLGTSIQHIASKEQNFQMVSTNTLLQSKYNIYLNGEFMVYKNIIGAIPLFFYQLQDRKYEVVLGPGISINLAPRSNERNKLKLGCTYRMDDAFIPWMHWEKDDLSIQISFDANTSPLRIATNSYGGIELSLGYLVSFRKERTRQMDFCPYIWF